MAEPDNGLFAIEVDTEDYAETAAVDTPAASRTHQSEADFAAVKASYQAKQDNGDHYAELLRTVLLLDSKELPLESPSDDLTSSVKPKLGKREQALLSYACGELYYDGEFAKLVELCERVQERFLVDKKLTASLEKWSKRAGERLAAGRKKGEDQ